MILLRSFVRRSGIKRALVSLSLGASYEDRFQQAMLASIEPGDCVWDIGANIGHYSQRFAKLVGERGRVVCFEPSSANAALLRQNVAHCANVAVAEIALGKSNGVVLLQQGEDSLGATTRVVDPHATGSEDATRVTLMRGESLVEQGMFPEPNVLKVDTEGFELDVLEGLGRLLKSESLRTVCVEVHFGLLAGRGIPNAPAAIESLMRKSDFRCTWTDLSHIIARRQS
jgi:FkbM family methyltransferase